MHIIAISSCPPWCDPRAHIQHDAEDCEHRSAGMTWKPLAADTEVTVHTTQNAGAYGSTSVPMVRLLVRDLALDTDAESDLDPADAGCWPPRWWLRPSASKPCSAGCGRWRDARHRPRSDRGLPGRGALRVLRH